jgi:xanthine phosphoribosyltransferase
MDSLKERILKDGRIINGNVLQVGKFLNHLVDVQLLSAIGKEFARFFKDCQPTKIITIESSGIPIAAITSLEMQIPFVFAKKNYSSNLTNDVYSAKVYSFTKKTYFDIYVEKDFIKQTDRLLIIDDFLACGSAANGLIEIIKEADAVLLGVGICIEKSFQQGASNLIKQGINVHSLVKIKSLENGIIDII